LSCAVGDFTSQQLRVADFNGDGKADIVLLQKTGACHSTNDPSPTVAANALEHLQIFNSTGVHDTSVIAGTNNIGNFYFTPGYSWEHEDASDTACSNGNSFCYASSLVFQIADVNGDGLPDVAFASYYAPGTSAVVAPPAQAPNGPVTPIPGLPVDPNYADGVDQRAGWVYQINTGDGRFGDTTCVVVNNNQPPDGCILNPGPLEVQFGDYDGDGKADFFVPNQRDGTTGPCLTYYAYLWVGAPLGQSGFSTTPVCTPFMSPDIGSGAHHLTGYMVDLDGDGYADQLIINALDEGGDYHRGGWKTTRTTAHHKPRNVITQIKTGLGAVTQFNYAPLTYSSVYYREFDGSSLYSGWGSPVQDAFAPSYVVQYAASSAPIASDPTNTSTIRYQYAGMKVQGGGRGALGFHKGYSTDMQTGIEAVTTYNQAYPLAGTPVQTTAYDLPAADLAFDTLCDPAHGGNPDSTNCMTPIVPADAGQNSEHIISDTKDSWNFIPALSTPPTPTFVYRSGSAQRKYDLQAADIPIDPPPGGGPVGIVKPAAHNRLDQVHAHQSISVVQLPIGGGPINGGGYEPPLSAQQSFFTYNIAGGELTSYGELLGTVTTDYADVDSNFKFSSPIRTTTTVQQYGGDQPANWYIGRLSSSTTTVAAASGVPADEYISSVALPQRKSTFEYDPATGQLMVEHLQPGVSDSQAIDKYHFHDAAGNEIETATCSATARKTAANPSGCSSDPTTMFSASRLPVFIAPANDPNWVERYTRTQFNDGYGIYPSATYAAFSDGANGATEYLITPLSHPLIRSKYRLQPPDGMEVMS